MLILSLKEHFDRETEIASPKAQKKQNIELHFCHSKVDAEGVVTAKGNCDDERNTAYDGPDADNTCKMPFFWDGRWYENCTLYPKDDYWCATKINPDTREMLDGECFYKNFLLKKMNILKINFRVK